MNSVVMGRPEVPPITGGFGAMSSWGRGRNDFGGNTDGQKRTVLRCQFKAFNLLQNSFCHPCVDLVHHSAKISFYQQMILLVLEITNLLVVGRRRWHFFPNNEFSGIGNGNAGGAANCWWFGCNVKLGTGGNDFGSNKDGRRGRCYAVNSKHSIVLKTQFVAHVLIRYTILPKPLLPNK